MRLRSLFLTLAVIAVGIQSDYQSALATRLFDGVEAMSSGYAPNVRLVGRASQGKNDLALFVVFEYRSAKPSLTATPLGNRFEYARAKTIHSISVDKRGKYQLEIKRSFSSRVNGQMVLVRATLVFAPAGATDLLENPKYASFSIHTGVEPVAKYAKGCGKILNLKWLEAITIKTSADESVAEGTFSNYIDGVDVSQAMLPPTRSEITAKVDIR